MTHIICDRCKREMEKPVNLHVGLWRVEGTDNVYMPVRAGKTIDLCERCISAFHQMLTEWLNPPQQARHEGRT